MSIYGETFADENFLLKHTGPGLLSLVRCVAVSFTGSHESVCILIPGELWTGHERLSGAYTFILCFCFSDLRLTWAMC
jgi:hypothetical protein